MPTPRRVLAVAEGADGRVYAIGGSNGSDLTTVETYTPQESPVRNSSRVMHKDSHSAALLNEDRMTPRRTGPELARGLRGAIAERHDRKMSVAPAKLERATNRRPTANGIYTSPFTAEFCS